MTRNTFILAAALMFFTASGLVAQKSAFAEEKTVSGTVQTVKDDDGKVTSINVSTDDGTKYSITMDDKSEKLKEMAGKKVSVTGDVAEKDNKVWLTVSSIKSLDE